MEGTVGGETEGLRARAGRSALFMSSTCDCTLLLAAAAVPVVATNWQASNLASQDTCMDSTTLPNLASRDTRMAVYSTTFTATATRANEQMCIFGAAPHRSL